MRALYRNYGKIAIVVYCGISLTTFGLVYLMVKAGLDVKAIFDKLGLTLPDWGEKAGSLLLTYALYKLLFPLRLSTAVIATPRLALYLRRFKWFQP